MRVFAIIVGTIAVTGFSSVPTLRAQETDCELKLEIYSYERVNKPKAQLRDVTVRLRGKGVEQTITVGGGSNKDGFSGLKERTYELEVSKAGYKTRRKKVDLDCRLQSGNSVWDHTYLWPEKKTGLDTDFVESSKDDFRKPSGDATGSTDVSKAASDGLFGSVRIQVLIDVDGNVLSASRARGDRKLAEKAIVFARTAKFAPTILNGEAVQVSGYLTYNFVP